jgi:eukaryotic-like serine/threonine-protein kinase
MAPEQVQGQAGKLSDVYSLGAILYAGLCGRPPHQAASVLETIRQIFDKEPVAPSSLNGQIPRDLETIALKLIAKHPNDRYPTAADAAAELTRFMEGKPMFASVVAYRITRSNAGIDRTQDKVVDFFTCP